MSKYTEHRVHAQALRFNILAAPTVWLPRREALVEWLEKFIQRLASPAYALGETEAEDLAAVEKFLRTNLVPIA